MKRQINYGKILLVIFITILIWVWADKKQDREFEVLNTTISLDKSAAGDLWASFNNQLQVTIKKIVLKGPASQVSDIERSLKRRSLVLDFFFVPQNEGMTEPGEYKLDVTGFLEKSSLLRELGVTVEDCEPNTVDVEVVRLVKRVLTVRCRGEDGSLLKPKSIEPVKVEMLVPEDWSGERLSAFVRFSESEISQAAISAIEKTPYVDFPQGETTKAQKKVKITMPAEAKNLEEYTITGATVGFVLSSNLVGKYEPELLNYSDMAIVKIKATLEAEAAYGNQAYKMLVYILDGDEKDAGEQKKEVVYNFPFEFVRDEKIKLNQRPVTARFKLTALPSAP